VNRAHYHGTNLIWALAKDCKQQQDYVEDTLTLDNTPGIGGIDPSGQTTSPFDITANVTFTPNLDPTKGYIYAYLDGAYQAAKSCPGESCFFSYEEIKNRLKSIAPGDESHTILIKAKAGMIGPWAEDSTQFTVELPLPNRDEERRNNRNSRGDGRGSGSGNPSGSEGGSGGGGSGGGGSRAGGGNAPPDEGDCGVKMNSFVRERSRVFHEDIPISGTDFTLHYSTSRVQGYEHVFYVPATNDKRPYPCTRVLVRVAVAGRILEDIITPVTTNRVSVIAWDGLDDLAQRVTGVTTATVSVGYDDGSQVDWLNPREVLVYPYPYEYSIAEGWTVSNHHVMDPNSTSIIYRGDGMRAENLVEATLLGGEYLFGDENGTGHVFSPAGRHERTIDLESRVTLYEFGYDGSDRLITITDRFNNVTTIQRDGNGVATGILSPDDILTTLTIDANGHLTDILHEDGALFSFEYGADGLMTAKEEPNLNRFEHVFDGYGRLTDVTDEEGGHWEFVRDFDAQGYIMSATWTGEGNRTLYVDHVDLNGGYTSTITSPTGAEMEYTRSFDGLTVTETLPCGLDLDFEYALDSEYGYKYVTEVHETTPAPLVMVTLRQRTYEDTNQDDVPDLITETVVVNGTAASSVNNTLQGQEVTTSPEGRTVTEVYDPATLLTTSLQIPGLYDTGYGYDTRGRLTSITVNARQTDLAYNTRGFLESVTDPENETTIYTYDAVGRVTGIDPPDTPLIEFEYDDNGNMTVLTTPGGIDHTFGYSQVNLNDSYTTPLSGSYSYTYDKDRRLTQITFPSTEQITYGYDNGRLDQIQTPEGNVDYTYLCDTKVDTITMGPESITYGYDGPLVTSETPAGTLNQTLSFTFDNDFLVDDFTYAGSLTDYGYDDDGLLNSSGPFSISRNAGNGLPEAVTGGTLSLDRSFSGYGELDGEDFTVNGIDLASWDVVSRDLAGRILTKTETISGTPEVYEYTYDAAGRLRTVTKDSILVEEYQYWPDGTRSYEMNSLRGIPGRTFDYDNENHLLNAGATTYQYDVDGFLTDKIEGLNTTEYVYSSRGELLRVDLPNGTVIEYVHDPLGRRIAKKVDSVIEEKYLWQGLTRLLAVYDGNDALVMRFEYADGRMPVSMTSGGAAYYLAYDQVGSLRVVADASGNVVKRVDYDSFGNVVADTNPTFDVPFGFAGGLHDRDTGLVRFGYRDYDPDVGRWTAKDPIGFAGGDTDLYGYCLNDPVNWVDPEGLRTLHIFTDTNISEKVEEELPEGKLKRKLKKPAACLDKLIHHDLGGPPGDVILKPDRDISDDAGKQPGIWIEYKW
jgi:RHS repeat-associated protein